MGKAILVMDMPECCSQCKLEDYESINGSEYCSVSNKNTKTEHKIDPIGVH